jgi:hypothetical protein
VCSGVPQARLAIIMSLLFTNREMLLTPNIVSHLERLWQVTQFSAAGCRLCYRQCDGPATQHNRTSLTSRADCLQSFFRLWLNSYSSLTVASNRPARSFAGNFPQPTSPIFFGVSAALV